MHLFLTYTILGLVTGRGLRDCRVGTRPHVHDLGDLQLRPGRHGHAGRLHLLAAPLRLELAGPARAVRGHRGAGTAARHGALRRHHAGAARDGRRHQDRGHHRHHARADRAGPVDLESRRAPDRRPLLRQHGEVQGARRLRHRSRGHRPRLRRAHRGGHPPALHQHPHRCGHAGRGRQPGAAPAQRGTARTAGRLLVGARRRAGRRGRHPHHPDQRRHPRRPRADPARARLHRRRHVRPAAQHLAHLRRCARPRLGGDVRAGLLPLESGPGPRTSASRCP